MYGPHGTSVTTIAPHYDVLLKDQPGDGAFRTDDQGVEAVYRVQR